MDTKSTRILDLDVFRGIAAMVVVLYHYTVRYDELYGHAHNMQLYFSLGQYGVHLFFMISGYVIFMTLEKTRYWLDFLVSRFSRLFPAYWAGIFLTFAVVSTAGLPGREVGIGATGVNFSMLQFLVPVPNVDGAYWTLALELSFYAIMFLLHQAKLFVYIDYVAIGWLAILVLVHSASSAFHLVIPDRLMTLLLLEYAQLFIAGIMFYKISKDGFSLMRGAILLAALGVHYYLTDWVSACAVAICMLVFTLSNSGLLKWIAVTPLIFLGTISYTLYLVHQNIGYVVLRLLYKLHFHPYLSIVIAIGVVIGLASMVTFFIEKPALQFIRTKYKNNRYASAK
jgi:peptidoglycan/LPS O-acetylase OafA/YrhL